MLKPIKRFKRGPDIPLRYKKPFPIIPTDGFGPMGSEWWSSNAIWGWDAVNGRYMTNRKRAPESAVLTFLRSTTAYSFNSDGISWDEAAINVMRPDPGGTLLEPAATNMLIQTGDLTHAAWTKGATVTVETTSDPAPPDGYGNWFKVNRGSEGANAVLLSQNTVDNLVIGEWYTSPVYFKATGSDIGKLIAVEAKRGTGGTYHGNTTVLRLTGQPQRLDAFFQSATGDLKGALVIKLFTGEFPTSVYVCCPQFEKGAVPSSPIESVATPGQRAADAASLILPRDLDLNVKFGGSRPVRAQSRWLFKDKLRQIFQSAGNPNTITRLYGTSNVLDYETGPTDICFEDPTDRNRAEIMTGTRYAKETVIWNAYDLLIKPGWSGPTNTATEWCIMGQWHGDASDGRSPYIATDLIGNDLVFYWRTVTGPRQELWRISNVKRGVYYRIIMEHKVSATVGYMKLWVNGVNVANSPVGAFGYYDHAQAGYWKEGIYRSIMTAISRCRIQNSDDGTVDLSDRILNPLPLDLGEQVIAATAGTFALNAANLNRPIVASIMGTAA